VAALKHAILAGEYDMPEEITSECAEIIDHILRRKPEWRFTMRDVMI